MTVGGIGIQSLAAVTPSIRKTNDYWRKHFPTMVSNVEQRALAKLWSAEAESTPGSLAFDLEMKPFLNDPFRGTVERHVLGEGESSITMGEDAARAALDAAGLSPTDIDLMIVSSFLPSQIGPGDAAFLARRLGLRGAAWNLESACASALVALQTAEGLVRAGQYRRVLVVVTCTYSPTLEDTDTMSWFLGDGAGAFVVGALADGFGILGWKTVHTGETCGAASFRGIPPAGDAPAFRFTPGPDAGRVLRDSSGPTLARCCEGAAEAAGVRLSDIDFFVFNSATAWFAPFCTRALGVDPARTLNPFQHYANIGPALTPTNLWHAANENRIKRGDLVMVYAVGSVSSASAVVMRWGHPFLSPPRCTPMVVDPPPRRCWLS